ncbi:hypothetical protein KAW80_04520 [Candidatus Babeliales bacterium]|nr:hypothetical protein [Candidatus Babeliales bacterium]
MAVRAGTFKILSSFLVPMFLNSICLSAPVNTYHDPVVFHGVNGINPFPSKKFEKQKIIFDFVPFYHYAYSAKNGSGTKVPEGDRISRWNMIGLLQGAEAAPGDSTSTQPGGFLGDLTPTLSNAFIALSNSSGIGRNYTEETFTDSTQTLGFYSVPIDYEKFGLRGQLNIKFGGGLGIRARGGFAYYKQAPIFNDQTPTSTNYGFSNVDAMLTQTHLMLVAQREAIGNEISLNFDGQTKTGLEDTHLALYWTGRFGMNDEEGNHVVSVIPYFEIGAWLPTGEKKDQNRAFSLPLGNNGFAALTGEAALNFDFPGTIQLGIGGNFSIFDEKKLRNFRVPSSLNQEVIYPWTTTVRMRPGMSWSLYGGFKGEDFIEGLSFYFNYIYTRHEEDGIKVLENASLFKPGKLEDESVWNSQMIHFGLDYDITKELAFGAGVQLPVTGKRIYKTTTLQGNIRFRF